MKSSVSYADRQLLIASLSSPLLHANRAMNAVEDLPNPGPMKQDVFQQDARVESLQECFNRFNIKDGSVLSFHHHFRNGDRLMNCVLKIAADRGLTDLTIAPSSIFPVHGELAELIRSGVISNIVTDYMKGEVADAVTDGYLSGLALLQTHGGRARAISSGQLKIDVAFVGAPKADIWGNTTGRQGEIACGPLGYPMVDAMYARHCVIAAHDVSDKPLLQKEIPSEHVDAVVHFNHPGLPEGISFGATVPLDTEPARKIGKLVVETIKAAGLFKDGLSFQSGAGGYSLGAVPHIGSAMKSNGIVADFISGGITAAHVEIVQKGLAKKIWDVQCFDQAAVESSSQYEWHKPMSAAQYASPIMPQAIVDQLDVMLLGAIEIDREFNVNVVSGGNGRIFGGPGGHPDTASGAKLAIVTTTLTGGGYAKIVDQVRCVSTPGNDVDVLVTDRGIAVNSTRPDLREALKNLNQPVVSIESLINQARDMATHRPFKSEGSPCALIESRDGRILDVVFTR